MSTIAAPTTAPEQPVAPIPVAEKSPKVAEKSPPDATKAKAKPSQEGMAGEAAPDGLEAKGEKEETPAERRIRLKTLVDGEEKEEDFDEPTLRRLVQKAKASDKRFAEAAELAKSAKRVIEEAKNPERRREALTALLGSEDAVREFAESVLAESWRATVMTPEERELERERGELEALRAEKRARAQAEQQAAAKKLEREVETRLEKTVASIAKGAGLPEAPWAKELVADVLRPYVEHGIAATQDDIVAEVKEAMRARAKERDELLVGNLEGKALLDYLGPKMVRRILAATVEAHAPGGVAEAVRKPKAPEDEPIDLDGKDRFLAPWEYEERLRKRGLK